MIHKGTQTIETKRLILRAFTPDDAEAAFENWMSDLKVTKFLRWKTHADISDSRKIVNEWVSRSADPEFYQWAIVTSRDFLLYRDEAGEKTIYGSFVIKLSDDKTISCVYIWDESLTPQYCPVKRTGPEKTDN